MLLSESELNTYNADAILDEAVILDEAESVIKLPAVPVVENSRIGAAVVSFNDLDSIVEDYGCDYEDAFCAIAEQNELDPDTLAVSVEDWKLIETPELADLVPNIVVKSISENNIVYQMVDYCLDEYCNTGDENYLQAILENYFANAKATPENSITYDTTKGEYPDLSGDHSESLVKKSAGNFVKNHKVGGGLGVAGTAAATALIAKKIAALRKQQKQNPGLSGKIQNLINMLKAKLRH